MLSRHKRRLFPEDGSAPHAAALAGLDELLAAAASSKPQRQVRTHPESHPEVSGTNGDPSLLVGDVGASAPAPPLPSGADATDSELNHHHDRGSDAVEEGGDFTIELPPDDGDDDEFVIHLSPAADPAPKRRPVTVRRDKRPRGGVGRQPVHGGVDSDDEAGPADAVDDDDTAVGDPWARSVRDAVRRRKQRQASLVGGGGRQRRRSQGAPGAELARREWSKLMSEYRALVPELAQQYRVSLLRADQDGAYAATLLHTSSTPADASTQKTRELFETMNAELRRVQRCVSKLAVNDALPPLVDDASPCPGLRGTLLPHQCAGVNWLVDRRRIGGAILADEMGLGKTVQVIALLCGLAARHGIRGPHIIVVPLSTVPNWRAEIERFDGLDEPMRVMVFTGNKDERRATVSALRWRHDSERSFDVVVVPHHFMQRNDNGLVKALQRVEWECLVVDEAHRAKNGSAAFTRAISAIPHVRYRIALTGTPLQNDLTEMWSLLQFLFPSLFVRTAAQRRGGRNSNQPHSQKLHQIFSGLAEARQRTVATTGQSNPNADFLATDSVEREMIVYKKIHSIIEPFILRRERDILAEPPQWSDHTIPCPIMPLQAAELESLLLRPVNATIEARKILIHPYTRWMEFDVDERMVASSGKMLLLDVVLQFVVARWRHRALIFSDWTTALDMVEYLLQLRQMPYFRLDGRTKLEERQRQVAEFSRRDAAADGTTSSGVEPAVFLLTKGAGGTGLNLQAADTVILLDVHYNPQQDLQALSRVVRVGQNAIVRVFRLTAVNGVEQRMQAIAQSKVHVEQRAIRAGRYDKETPRDVKEAILRAMLVGGASAARPDSRYDGADDSMDEDDERGPATVGDVDAIHHLIMETLSAALPRTMKEFEDLAAVLPAVAGRLRDAMTASPESAGPTAVATQHVVHPPMADELDAQDAIVELDAVSDDAGSEAHATSSDGDAVVDGNDGGDDTMPMQAPFSVIWGWEAGDAAAPESNGEAGLDIEARIRHALLNAF